MHDHDDEAGNVTHLPGLDRMLTRAQLAERWHMSTGYLANQASAGLGLPYVKIGSRVLYRLGDVLQYEADRLVQPVAEVQA